MLLTPSWSASTRSRSTLLLISPMWCRSERITTTLTDSWLFEPVYEAFDLPSRTVLLHKLVKSLEQWNRFAERLSERLEVVSVDHDKQSPTTRRRCLPALFELLERVLSVAADHDFVLRQFEVAVHEFTDSRLDAVSELAVCVAAI